MYCINIPPSVQVHYVLPRVALDGPHEIRDRGHHSPPLGLQSVDAPTGEGIPRPGGEPQES